MPELYCGYARKADERKPVEYPVACSPQAWAAGALPYALYRLLGLKADAANATLRIDRPQLPERVDWLELRGMRVGGAVVELRFHRDGGTTTWDADVREGELHVQNA
jgi:glycogen debranching enzyme